MSDVQGIYPNELVPDEVKDTPEYGLSVAKFIENQWFGGDNRYSSRLAKYDELRRHMKGRIDMKDMYDILGLDHDASKDSVDYTPPRVVAKFVNDVVDGFSTRVQKIKAVGNDPISNSKKEGYRDHVLKMMMTSDFTAEMDKRLNTNLSPEEKIPDSMEEFDLMMRFDYHTASEVVVEDSIEKIMSLNEWDQMEREVKEDLVLLGEGGCRVKRNGGQITYERVVPENFIHSIDVDDSADHRGTFYYGHVKRMTVSDFKRYASSRGEHLDDKYIRALTGKSGSYISKGSSNGKDDFANSYDDEQAVIEVIDFAYKTFRHITRKKRKNRKGGYSLIPKPSDFKADSEGKYNVIQSCYDVWYEGLYPVGGPGVVGYRLMDNSPRKRSNLKRSLSPYIYYTLRSESIGSRILPYAKQLNINFIKIQQHLSKMRPDGVAIDISALADIEISDGKTLTMEEIIKEYNLSGNLLYDGEKLEGEYGNKREPIRDNPAMHSDKIGQLIRLYLHNIQQIRDETGIANNPNPDPNSLIGVQKIAMANAQVSVRHISIGVLNITKRMAEATMMHLQMIARYGVHSKQLENALGIFNAASIKDFNEIGNLEYDVNLILEPEEEEKARFDMDLQIALKEGYITLDEKIDIERFNNVDYASQLLKIKIKKRRSEQMQEMQMAQEMEAQKSQQEMQIELMKKKESTAIDLESKKQMAAFEMQMKMDFARFEMELKQQYGNPDFNEKVQMEDIKTSGRIKVEEFKDQSKDQRQDKVSTQESKMIDQRKNDKAPINFENNGLGESYL